jgi:hypothetical protein
LWLGSLHFCANNVAAADSEVMWKWTFMAWRCICQILNDKILTIKASIVNEAQACNDFHPSTGIRCDPELCLHASRGLIFVITAHQHATTLVAADLDTYHSVIIGSDTQLPYRKPDGHLRICD